MAKDGTNRGGARPGAGRKPKALKEKLDAGNPGNHPLRRLDIPENIEGVDMPKPHDFLSAEQRDGKPLGADEIYTKMCRWLGKLGCDTKELMKLTLEQRIAHGGHPVLRWMMDNIFIRTDPAGNIKADKEKSTEKIDGAIATIMALDRAVRYSKLNYYRKGAYND